MADTLTDILSLFNWGKPPGSQQTPPPSPPPDPDITGAVNKAPAAPTPVQTRPVQEGENPSAFTLQNFMKIQEAQRRAAAQESMWNDLAQGGAGLGAALTGSPSTAQALTAISGHKAAQQPAGGVGNLTAEAFLKFGERAENLQKTARLKGAIPTLSKQYNLSPEGLQAILDTNPNALSEIIKTHNDPTREIKVLDDGRILSIRKNAAPGEQPIELGVDQGKVAQKQLHEAQTAAAVGGEKRAGEAAELATKEQAASDAALQQLSTQTGVPIETLRGMSVKERADLLRQQVKPPEPTAEQKTLIQINRERAAQDKPPLTMAEYKADEAKKTAELKRIEAGFGPIAADAVKTAREAKTSAEALDPGFAAREAMRGNLFRTGEGIVAGSALSPTMLAIRKVIATARGVTDDKVTNTEAMGAASAQEVLAMVKQLGAGTSISNADREFAEKMSGANVTTDPESIRRIMALHDQLARRMQLQHSRTISETVEGLPEGARPIIKPPTLRPPGAEELRYTSNQELLDVIRDPQYQRPAFDLNHGADVFDHTMNNFGKVIESKMQTRDEKTRTYSKPDPAGFDAAKAMTLEQLQTNRDRLDKIYTAKYGAATGAGLVDLIIEAKKAGKL